MTLQVVEGGVETTQQLLTNRFDYIFFTGSGPVGKLVRAAANNHLTPVTLELGGKSPVWVDNTADFAITARRLVWAKAAHYSRVNSAVQWQPIMPITLRVRLAFNSSVLTVACR